MTNTLRAEHMEALFIQTQTQLSFLGNKTSWSFCEGSTVITADSLIDPKAQSS